MAHSGDGFDLLIVGGGINGAGIARDAAGRGYRVQLVEQSDLAAFTSSASTKLIHGGLRYLEYGEFRLVREALIERERLLAIAPHVIWPLRFVLPHAEGLRPRWQIRLGLFAYDHIAGRKRLAPSASLRFDGTGLGAGLQSKLTRGFVYSDCWVEDSRLVVLNAMDAAARGASIVTRTRLRTAAPAGDHWMAELENVLTGERTTTRARAIVNAAGPWVGQVLQHSLGLRSRKHVRLIKGSHIVVPRLYEGDHAYLLQNPDRRVVFAIPYEHKFTLIGTTDVPMEGEPGPATISAAEIAYLCESVNRYLQRLISPDDIVWSYAGVRPLYDDDAASAAAVTRDYELEIEQEGHRPAVLSVFGGKITTYRSLAEHVLEKLQPLIGERAQAWTAKVALPGGAFKNGSFPAFLLDARQRWPFLPASLVARLARAYGTRMEKIVNDARTLSDLGEDFGAGLTCAEVDYLRQNEWARTAEDILWRRSKLGLHVPPETPARLREYLGESLDPHPVPSTLSPLCPL